MNFNSHVIFDLSALFWCKQMYVLGNKIYVRGYLLICLVIRMINADYID
jgi:hypothetical protein